VKIVLNGRPQGNATNYFKDIAEGKEVPFREIGMALLGSTVMRDSAAAWAQYTKALIGWYYLKNEETAKKDPNDKRTPLQIRTDLKGEFYGHTGNTRFTPAPHQNTFFSRCARDAELLKIYGPAFFFNGNIPFSQLQNISKKDKLLLACADANGLGQRYKDVLPEVLGTLSDPTYEHPLEAIFRRNKASISQESEKAISQETEEDGMEEEKEDDPVGSEEDEIDQETTNEDSDDGEGSEEL